jgi:hypothetical protein
MSEMPAMEPMKYVKMASLKMADKITLRRLLTEAKLYDFNRQGQMLNFDPDGTSVLKLWIACHDRSGNPSVSADDPVHHRTEVLAKVVGNPNPVNFFLDVRASTWESLPDVPTVKDVPLGHM